MSYNRTTLLGNLVRDPELRHLTSGNCVCDFSIAVNKAWTDKQGNKQEHVSYIDCEAWGRTAETITQYFHKGKPILVEGEIKQDRWEDNDGKKRSKLKVNVHRFVFLPRSKDDDEESRPPAKSAASSEPYTQITDEDIPF